MSKLVISQLPHLYKHLIQTLDTSYYLCNDRIKIDLTTENTEDTKKNKKRLRRNGEVREREKNKNWTQIITEKSDREFYCIYLCSSV